MYFTLLISLSYKLFNIKVYIYVNINYTKFELNQGANEELKMTETKQTLTHYWKSVKGEKISLGRFFVRVKEGATLANAVMINDKSVTYLGERYDDLTELCEAYSINENHLYSYRHRHPTKTLTELMDLLIDREEKRMGVSKESAYNIATIKFPCTELYLRLCV